MPLTSVETARRRRPRLARLVAALLVVLPLAALAVATDAAKKPARAPGENPHGDFAEDCELCHRADAWLPARPTRRFDHSKSGFPLEGAHAATACVACHGSLDFTQQQAMACASCHEDPHRGEMGTDCQRCHSARSFLDQARLRRLHQETRFPLNGGHAGLDCETCHRPAAQGQLRFVGTRAGCVECHMDAFRGATQPDHAGGGFSTECAVCHSPLGWTPARFDHARSGFPLTGAHRGVTCATCHAGGVYRGLSKDCVSCHRADYDGTTDPAHAAAGFPVTCASCHNTTSFSGASFSHAGTGFPLTGAHASQACAACHGDGVYAGKSTLCVSCHRTAYDGTTNPPHATTGFPTTCQDCHSTVQWAGATFNHDATYFRIYSGAHRARWDACSDCHTAPSNYAQFTCLTCHTRSSTDAEHQGRNGYSYVSSACYTCHRGV
jgi:hypothetical protein